MEKAIVSKLRLRYVKLLSGSFSMKNDGFVDGTTFIQRCMAASGKCATLFGVAMTGMAMSLVLSGCFPEEQMQRQNRFGVRGDGYTIYDPGIPGPAPQATPEPTQQTVDSEPEQSTAPIVQTPTPPPVANKLEYGVPVPGKPGFITSPHSPYAGQIDARGYPPGTELKDPYSGQVILVP